MQKVRWVLGILTAVVFLVLGFGMTRTDPRVGALLLAFGVLRGSIVARNIWLEVTADQESG